MTTVLTRGGLWWLCCLGNTQPHFSECLSLYVSNWGASFRGGKEEAALYCFYIQKVNAGAAIAAHLC